MSITICVAIWGVSSTVPSRVYHQVTSWNCSMDLLRRRAVACGQEAAGAQMLDQPLAVAEDPEPRDLELERGDRRIDPLEEAEVDECDAPVGEAHEVARMGIAENWWWRYMQPK